MFRYLPTELMHLPGSYMSSNGKMQVPPSQQQKFYQAFGFVSSLLHDVEIFKLISLVILTDGFDNEMASMRRLRSTLLKLLQRRFKAYNENLSFEKFNLAVTFTTEISKTLSMFLAPPKNPSPPAPKLAMLELNGES